MDRFSRLIALVFFALFASSANAVLVKVYDKTWAVSGIPDVRYTTAAEGANAYKNQNRPTYTLSAGTANQAGDLISYTMTSPSGNTVVPFDMVYGCAAGPGVGARPNMPACYREEVTCPGGQAANSQGVCDIQCPDAGTTEGDSSNAVQTGGSIPTSAVCIGGCAWKGGGSVPSGCLNGKCYTFGPFTATGATCEATPGGSGEPSQPVPDTEASCAKRGQGSITINGTTTCVPASSSESEKETSETKTDDNGTTKTDKKTNTKCEGAKCTTTTEETTTGPGGSSTTKTTTTEEPKQDYCQKNPKALECKSDDEESSWGGSCDSQFVCDGDAVQCAQAQAAWLTTCSLKTERTNSVVLTGKSAIEGSDRAGIEASLGKSQTSPFTLSSLINSNPVFGSTGGCPGDSSVSVAGVSVTIPFSSLCGMFNQIGIALQGLAFLVAAFIVFRKGQ